VKVKAKEAKWVHSARMLVCLAGLLSARVYLLAKLVGWLFIKRANQMQTGPPGEQYGTGWPNSHYSAGSIKPLECIWRPSDMICSSLSSLQHNGAKY